MTPDIQRDMEPPAFLYLGCFVLTIEDVFDLEGLDYAIERVVGDGIAGLD
jgi:hypothetical protein